MSWWQHTLRQLIESPHRPGERPVQLRCPPSASGTMQPVATDRFLAPKKQNSHSLVVVNDQLRELTARPLALLVPDSMKLSAAKVFRTRAQAYWDHNW